MQEILEGIFGSTGGSGRSLTDVGHYFAHAGLDRIGRERKGTTLGDNLDGLSGAMNNSLASLALAQVFLKMGPEPEQIAFDHVHAKISIADKALLNFCAKLNNQTSRIGSSDIEALRTYGFTDPKSLRPSSL